METVSWWPICHLRRNGLAPRLWDINDLNYMWVGSAGSLIVVFGDNQYRVWPHLWPPSSYSTVHSGEERGLLPFHREKRAGQLIRHRAAGKRASSHILTTGTDHRLCDSISFLAGFLAQCTWYLTETAKERKNSFYLRLSWQKSSMLQVHLERQHAMT